MATRGVITSNNLDDFRMPGDPQGGDMSLIGTRFTIQDVGIAHPGSNHIDVITLNGVRVDAALGRPGLDEQE